MSVIWRLDEGRAVASRIAAQVADFRVQMVGSVATRGASEKDLDLLLIPASNASLSSVCAALDAIRRLGLIPIQAEADTIGFFDLRDCPFRLIELWLSIPQDLWESQPYEQAIWSRIRTDRALFTSIRRARLRAGNRTNRTPNARTKA